MPIRYPCAPGTSISIGGQPRKIAAGMTTIKLRDVMSTARRFLLMSAAVCLAAIAASPASAESYSYQGQMQIQTSPGDVCLDGPETVFNINIYGRDDAPMLRFDGYLSGEKIVHAHFSGNDLSRLALTYVGESAPSRTLSLRVVGNGEFVGELQAVTLLSAMRGCKPFTARIRFSKTGTHTQADFERAANLYQVDSRASQAYNQGIQAGARGRIKEALPVVQQALEINEKALGAADPKMLAYYYYMAQLHLVEGSYREESDLDRKALAVCEHAYGADSRCTGLMLTVLAS